LKTKKFDKGLHDKYDTLARKWIKKIFPQKTYQCIDNQDKLGIDILVFYRKNHASNIELEVRPNCWANNKFKWETVHCPLRKKKFFKNNLLPTFFCIFSENGNNHLFFRSEDILKSNIVEQKNKFVFEGEYFFDIPIEKSININTVIEEIYNSESRKRFLKYIDKNGPIPSHIKKLSKCWIWIGATDGTYGLFCYKRKEDKAHRVSYTLFNEEIENGLQIHHKCDNPLCVNPNHLWEGTQKENVIDCAKKGRKNGLKNAAKLTQGQVDEIRKLHSKGNKQCNLAKKFKISKAQVCKIVNYQSWK
jgi:hypothetical protein